MTTTTPRKDKGENAGLKFLISGGVSWVYEFSIGHYLEFIKIVKQTKPGSYLQLTRELTAQKGIIGIWDGFFPWGSVQAIAKGAVFGGGHAFARGLLQPVVEQGYIKEMTAEICAGGFGGGVQGLVLSPLLLLKTRVMTDPIFRQKMSMMETTSQSAKIGMRVIQKEGIAALMKGSITFSGKRVADWSTRFLFAEMAQNMLYKQGNPNGKLTTAQKVTSSLIGGFFSSLVTIPIDVLVAQIQQASKAGQKVSATQLFMEKYKAGVIGFATKGFVARVAHVALTTMLMKTATSVVYDRFVRKA